MLTQTTLTQVNLHFAVSVSRGNLLLSDITPFGARLERAIAAAGMDQREFARRMGVAETRISGWKQSANPRMDTLLRMSGILNISVDWLVHGPSVTSGRIAPGRGLDLKAESAAAGGDQKRKGDR